MSKLRICPKCQIGRPSDRFGKRRECFPCGAATQRAYRVRNPNKRRDHYQSHKDRVLAEAAIYRAAHKNEERVSRRAHYQRNKDRVALATKLYREDNPALYAEAFARRRAARRQAIPSWADRTAIKAIYKEAARLTAETGVRHEVDHEVPLQSPWVCGLHWEGNLKIMPMTQNRAKANARWPDMGAIFELPRPRRCVSIAIVPGLE